jgi:hypothetical protein
MQVRHVRTISAARRSPLEPDTGLLAGTGAHTLALTVCGSPNTNVPLAERGFVTALLDWAGTHGADLSSLAPLRGATGRITSTELVAMIHQLTRLRDTAGAGLGWSLLASSTDQPRTYVRALIPTATPTVLLATPTAAVAVDLDGLRLRLRARTIHGWYRDDDRVVLHTGGGEYPLRGTTITAALLHRLAHGHTHGALVRRPLSDLTTPLLAGLHAAATLATNHEQPLLLISRPPDPITSHINAEPATAATAASL